MARYRATQHIAHGVKGMLEPGTEFDCDMPPGDAWEPLDDEAKAKVKALADARAKKPEIPVKLT
jgi:hypothetical protein